MDPSLVSRLKRGLRAGLLTAAGALSFLAGLAGPVRANSDSLTVTITPRDVWPPSQVTDLAASPGAEGQMMLQWTAPDSNNYVFATSSPASGYQIRIATFSVTSIGGSTTTWWNNAMDVTSLPAPAISATPPAPAFPGTTQYLLINQLWPGVTYYAMMISTDEAGNVSDADAHSIPPAVQASTLVYDAAPPAPLNLSVVAVSSSSLRVSWSSVTAYDLDYYKVYYDSTPPYNFSHSSTSYVTAPVTTELIAGLSAGTYIFKVTAVDRGQPRYPGVALESVAAGSVTIVLSLPIPAPQAPYGIALTSGAASVTLSWIPTVRFADMTPFALSTAPTASELSGYGVWRSSSIVLGTWTDVAVLSTATLTWTDLTGDASPGGCSFQCYYEVYSENATGLSARSVVRTGATKAAYVIGTDNQSFFEVMPNSVLPIEGVGGVANTAYLISASSRPQDLGSLNGRVVKSVEFDAYQGGLLLSPTLALSQPGRLSLHYELSSSSAVAASSFFGQGVPPTPSNMSVYWFNGVNWVQLYGALDPISQTMSVQTTFFGQYQLRTVERTGGFSFNMAGVSNRYLTPNGDHKNDNVVFTFDNPNDAAVVGKIFDLKGRLIVPSLPQGPNAGNSLMWDGTAGGRSVPGGVYIYQIQGEGQTFAGTLVIIK